jgi:hypothetical protein
MLESKTDNMPRRAIVAAPLIGIATFVAMLIMAAALDLPVSDPDGAVLGSPLVLIGVTLAVFITLDVLPRAAVRAGWVWRKVAATAITVLRERWTVRKLLIVVAALLGWYLTYVGYRNLKSFLPFASDANHDETLLGLDRDMAFGHDPGTVLHNLLGRGVAAHILSVVYVAFLLFVPLSLGVAVVWQKRLHSGLWYVAAMNLAWVLGTLSYYMLPALGPVYSAPDLYSGLPDTGVSALQQALLEHRGEVLADPSAAGGVQSIAAFASLHVAIVLVAALIGHLLGLARGIRIGLWTFLVLTVLATIYFGWHYIIDDIAGAVIGLLAVALGAAATGHELRPSRSRDGLGSRIGQGVGQVIGGDQQAALIPARVTRADRKPAAERPGD